MQEEIDWQLLIVTYLPWIVLFGAVIGIAASILKIVFMVKRNKRRKKKEIARGVMSQSDKMEKYTRAIAKKSVKRERKVRGRSRTKRNR